MLYLPPPRRLTLSLSAHLLPGDLSGSAVAEASPPAASSLSQRHCLRAALAACSTLRSSSLRPLLLLLRSSLGVRLLALASKLLLLRLPLPLVRLASSWRWPLNDSELIGSKESSRTGRVARHASGSSSSSPALPGRDQRPLLPGEPNDRADEELKSKI